MGGGEIFVPKIPSVRIIDVAKAVAPTIPIRVIGIRPGEKLHEVMCPSDDSHLTIEFQDHFVICPSIIYFSRTNDFNKNGLNEKGKLVEQGFEYSSGKNSDFLDVESIKTYNKNI